MVEAADKDPINLIIISFSMLLLSIFFLHHVLNEKASQVVVGLERKEQDKVEQDNDLESDQELVAVEQESATEQQEEEERESHKSNLVSTSNEEDEDSDDTAVSLAAADLCAQSKLELDSPQVQAQVSTTRVMEQEPTPISCLDINSDNVLDHLPSSLSKSLMFMEQFFEKSTDLTAKGISLGMKPFEMAFGLHLKPAFESSRLFVLKQKSTIVDIVKKRAMSA